MTTTIKFELEQAFKAECKIIDLKQEYTGYREAVRWAIATDLTEKALREKYHIIIEQYAPFILLTMEHAKIIVQFHSNERKHKKRNAERGDAFGYEDGEIEKYHPELVDDPFSEPDMTWLYKGLDMLDPIQRERITKHYIEGMSVAEIAAADKVSFQSVYKSIERGLNDLRKKLKNFS